MRKAKYSLVILLLLSHMLCNADRVDSRQIQISAAEISLPVPTAKVLAAYMHITNHSDQAATLIAVTSPSFNAVSLHETKIENGIVRMHPRSSLVIPADESLRLKPGGLHLMLHTPTTLLEVGNHALLNIIFKDGSTITVSAEIKTPNTLSHL